MTFQSAHWSPVVTLIGCVLLPLVGYGQTIELPDLLAIEAPDEATALPIDDPAVIDLLIDQASAGSAELSVSVVGGDDELIIGSNQVTWTAEEPPGNVVATRTEFVYLLRHGQTPVATSRGPVGNGPGYSTAGNHGANVVRDRDGGIHVAWRDKAPAVMYRRGTQDEDTGVITWSGPAIDISDGTAVERCFPALAVSDDAVHFAWRGTGNEVHYRRLRRDGGGWNFESVRVTGADGNSSDNGPDIAVYGDDEIHVIARSMEYAYSRDGGLSWDAEDLSSRLPPGNIGFKYPALTVDPRGHVHVLVTSRLRDNYWPLWYMHRERPTTGGPGGWLEEHHPFSDKPDWQDPGAGGPDLFLDWVDIESDDAGNLHIGWHGTFFTGVFAQDDAFYATRAFVDDGDAAAWSDPQALHRANPGTNFFSFTPSIATDSASDSTFAVFMIKALGLAPADNYDDLDSGLRILRNGSFIDNALRGSGDYIALSDAANWSVATWWPTTAPRLHRHPSGRVWLDVLQSMLHGASSDDFALIVHQRYEVTEVLGAPVDSDMDGVPDVQDQFPNDPAESVDTDGDGIGDNADTDDDGDGVPDVRDAFSLDPDESVDTDRDGVGNNADTDDDGDGTPDAEDAFPLDPSRSTEPSSENPPAADPPAEDPTTGGPPIEEPAGEVEEPVIDGGVDDGTSGSSAGAQDSGAGDSGGSALGFIALALLVLAGSVVRSRRGRRPSAAR